MYRKAITPDYFNQLSHNHFPGVMGIRINHLEEGLMRAEMAIKPEFFAPNGYLHAGSIVTFADTLAGYATMPLS